MLKRVLVDHREAAASQRLVKVGKAGDQHDLLVDGLHVSELAVRVVDSELRDLGSGQGIAVPTHMCDGPKHQDSGNGEADCSTHHESLPVGVSHVSSP